MWQIQHCRAEIGKPCYSQMKVLIQLNRMRTSLVSKSLANPKYAAICARLSVFKKLTMALQLTQFSWCASSLAWSACMPVLPCQSCHILTFADILAISLLIFMIFVPRWDFSLQLISIICMWRQSEVQILPDFGAVFLQKLISGNTRKTHFFKGQFLSLNDLIIMKLMLLSTLTGKDMIVI